MDASSATATYGVLGLTCGGCASRVAASIKELDGVLDAQVTAVPGGISTTVITGSRPIAESAIAEAVARAGYRLAETHVDGTQGLGACCSN